MDVLAQISRFASVGLAATLGHLVLAWLLVRGAGIAPYWANGMAFAGAFSLSYLGHFFWTFGRRQGHRRHLPRFLVVSFTGYALTNLIIWAVHDRLGLTFEAALLAILVIVPPFTWLLSRLWAFRAQG